jgi:hypothetical protein
MSNDDAPESDAPDNQKKTGRLMPGTTNLDPLTVRSALRTPQAVAAYDKYLKDHKRRLQQLERLARGEMTPSSESYR